jgi:hypothetical protein
MHVRVAASRRRSPRRDVRHRRAPSHAASPNGARLGVQLAEQQGELLAGCSRRPDRARRARPAGDPCHCPPPPHPHRRRRHVAPGSSPPTSSTRSRTRTRTTPSATPATSSASTPGASRRRSWKPSATIPASRPLQPRARQDRDGRADRPVVPQGAPNSRVITTAPTWAQVEQLLWREIRAAVGRAHRRGRREAFPEAVRDEARARRAVVRDRPVHERAGTLPGPPRRLHPPRRRRGQRCRRADLRGRRGVPDRGGRAHPPVGNPTKVGGQFHRAFTTERAQWHTIHISTFDTPNYTGEPSRPSRPVAAAQGLGGGEGAAWGVKQPDVPGPCPRRTSRRRPRTPS